MRFTFLDAAVFHGARDIHLCISLARDIAKRGMSPERAMVALKQRSPHLFNEPDFNKVGTRVYLSPPIVKQEKQ